MDLPEGMTLENVVEGLERVNKAVNHSCTLTAGAEDIITALETALHAANAIDTALDAANVKHVQGEFNDTDVAVITAADAYLEAEITLLQALLNGYILPIQSDGPGLAAKLGLMPQ